MKRMQVFVGVWMMLMPFLCTMAFSKNEHNALIIQQGNTAPVIKIINPKNRTIVNAATPVNYSVTVSDKEDGDSKYDEINVKEVLLKVQYVSDTSTLPTILSAPVQKDAAGLAVIRSSNCFNCHNFNNKLIGPSFNDISKKYAPNTDNIALLQKHILDGSTGVWGNVSMPSHPELNKEQAANMVQWIMQLAADNNTTYYIGTTGSFQIPVNQKGVYVLTASYTDHGLEDDTSQRLKGEGKVVIYCK